MKPTIGIIGIRGRYGKWLQRFFIQFGYQVIGSDSTNGGLSNEEVVKNAGVVIFAVTLRNMIQAIKELAPYSRADQLFMDIGSLKEGPINAMLESNAQVVGLHPMCAPGGENWRGQTIVYKAARLTNTKWRQWVKQFLARTKANIKIADPAKHDWYAAFVQNQPHAAQLAMASVMRVLGCDIAESLTYTSPVYRITLSLISRMLAQDPNVYADIQMLNPNSLVVLDELIKQLRVLRGIIGRKDYPEFLRLFELNRDHFGKQVLDDAFRLFENLHSLMRDLNGQEAIVLEIKRDKPGTLHKILGFLAQANINLTSLHSEKVEAGYRFHIGINQPRKSRAVKKAILNITDKLPVSLAT